MVFPPELQSLLQLAEQLQPRGSVAQWRVPAIGRNKSGYLLSVIHNDALTERGIDPAQFQQHLLEIKKQGEGRNFGQHELYASNEYIFVKQQLPAQFIEEIHELSLEEALILSEQLTRGVAQMHESDIAHGNLGGENIYVAQNGQLIIHNTGLTQLLEDTTPHTEGDVQQMGRTLEQIIKKTHYRPQREQFGVQAKYDRHPEVLEIERYIRDYLDTNRATSKEAHAFFETRLRFSNQYSFGRAYPRGMRSWRNSHIENEIIEVQEGDVPIDLSESELHNVTFTGNVQNMRIDGIDAEGLVLDDANATGIQGRKGRLVKSSAVNAIMNFARIEDFTFDEVDLSFVTSHHARFLDMNLEGPVELQTDQHVGSRFTLADPWNMYKLLHGMSGSKEAGHQLFAVGLQPEQVERMQSAQLSDANRVRVMGCVYYLTHPEQPDCIQGLWKILKLRENRTFIPLLMAITDIAEIRDRVEGVEGTFSYITDAPTESRLIDFVNTWAPTKWGRRIHRLAKDEFEKTGNRDYQTAMILTQEIVAATDQSALDDRQRYMTIPGENRPNNPKLLVYNRRAAQFR